ncbi:hypothetical protein HanIR_Chr16g0788791 [Helianthus annuus]|nr:hypothetical protein HanIR_Chr16g0788791 [Helianthus annuus]
MFDVHQWLNTMFVYHNRSNHMLHFNRYVNITVESEDNATIDFLTTSFSMARFPVDDRQLD